MDWTVKQVMRVRERFIAGETVPTLAMDYGVDPREIMQIIDGTLFPEVPGERMGHKSMMERVILDIREAYPKYLQKELADMYGYHRSMIGRIARGQVYKELGGPLPVRRSLSEQCHRGHDLTLPDSRNKEGMCRKCRRITQQRWDRQHRNKGESWQAKQPSR